MHSFLSVIGAAFWIVNSVTAVDDNETIVTLFAKAYHDLMNINTTDVLAGNSDYGFYLNELQKRLLPIGELVRNMPKISMADMDEKDREMCTKLGHVLKSNQDEVVLYDFLSGASSEYNTHILPILNDTNNALISECENVPAGAGSFVNSCWRYRTGEMLDVFERLFRENCEIDCHVGSKRNRRAAPTIEFNATNCVLETLVLDYTFEKKSVTDRVRLYGRHLVMLLMTTILCDYTTNVNVSPDIELFAFTHTLEITKVARHIVKYVNWKMSRAWPDMSAKCAKTTLSNYAVNSSLLAAIKSYPTIAREVQNRLNEIGDYRYAYQVLISSARTLSVVSTDMRNVHLIPDFMGIDCLVVRHKIGQGTTERGKMAHQIMEDNFHPIITHMDNRQFRPDSVTADLKNLGDELGLTLPSELTYSTVVVQHSGHNNLSYGIAVTVLNNHWIANQRKRSDASYRLFFFL